MWSVIVTQLLTLALALLGALLGVIFGTWFIPGQRLNPRAWQWIIVLGLISIGAIVYLVAEARAIEHRIKVVGRRIEEIRHEVIGIDTRMLDEIENAAPDERLRALLAMHLKFLGFT